MGVNPFVHLHVHTEYSLLDGAIRLPDLIKTAKNWNMPAVTITDHGHMFGVLKFYQQALKVGIKPIIGVETYVAGRGRRRRDPKDPIYHLLLLAQDLEGYRNLSRLISLANMEGFYYKPRVDLELLEEFNHGLIAMSSCLQGEVPRLILDGQEKEAQSAAERYARIFEGRYYLELQRNYIPEQDTANHGLIHLAKKLGLPLVATNDCHYLTKKSAEYHDVLLCIQTGKTVDEVNRLHFNTSEFYYKSPEEMAELFRDVPEALDQSLAIAERCHLELPLKGYHFPEYPLKPGESLDGQLTTLARTGLEKRLEEIRQNRGLTDSEAKEYRDRLEMELEVIIKMGFSGYFLIVSDFIGYAKSHHIPVGPGRGSAAGSLVAYALAITNIDPRPYGLLFERFLNVERISMPDIDVDFCTDGREEVIRYVAERYGGQERVAQIITFGQMQARAVIRDVGRALGLAYGDVDRIAKLIPQRLNITLADALDEEPRLKETAESDSRVARLLETAQALEALPRHASTHAAGVVIGDRPLMDYLPLYCVSSGNDADQQRVVVTQFDMKDVEKIGLIKFDFLGLKTLTLITQVQKLLQNRNIEIDLDHLDLTDQTTYRLLGLGDTTGVFQLESSGMRDILVRLKPTCFEDIIALVALYRPGPLKSGMVDTFIDGKHGRVETTYELPQLEPILKETYGVILYQEQVMQIASLLANYSLGEADILRRAMGKKNPEEMAKQKGRFMDGARTNQIDEKKADKIFDLMANFAEYGFNKSHSAAYALITFQTAYLKAHYRMEFMAALLTSEVGNQEKIVRLISECRDHHLVVLPPDINQSGVAFSVADQQIRFGLEAIKGVGQSAIESILEARQDSVFIDLFDFCERVDLRRVNRRVIEALIKCGAFDSTGVSRAKMAAAVDEALERGAKIQKEKEQGQSSLFEVLGSPQEAPSVRWPEVPEWRESLRLSYEKESLGFYITGHPLARYEKELASLTNADAERIKEMADKSQLRLGGVVVKVQPKTTKKGDRYAIVTVEDLTGIFEVLVWPDAFQACQEELKPDAPVLVIGELTSEEKGGTVINKVKAKDIMPLEKALEKMAKHTMFQLSAIGMERRDIHRFRAILDSHRGQTPATLKVLIPGQGSVIMKLEGGVKAERDLLREMREAFGEGAVTVQY